MLGNTKSEKDYLIKGERYLYKLKLQSDTLKNNIKITLPESDLFDIYKVTNLESNFEGNLLTENAKEIILPELENCDDVYIYIIPKETTSKEELANIYAIVSYEDINMRSNAIQTAIRGVDLQVDMQASNAGEEVKIGQEIEYTVTIKNGEDSIDLDEITIADNNLNLVDVTEILLNGNKLKETDYEIIEMPDSVEENGMIVSVAGTTELTVKTDLKVGETKVLKIKCEISNKASSITEKTEIKNHAEVSTNYSTTAETLETIHIVEPVVYDEQDGFKETYSEEDYGDNYDPNNGSNPSTPNTPNTPNDPNTPETPDNPSGSQDKSETRTYTISGVAWFDQNENGIKEAQEQKISGVTAKLMNLNTNETKTATTSASGFYSFSGLANGKYVVMFEYDTDKYMLTTYQADGANANSNSDVENVTIKDEKVSSTDTLEINNNSITDIDIGLVIARTFDLELTKTISKVSVITDEGTETTNYNGVTYAKAEIHAKHIEGSTVVVEYKIKVTNTGELPGYVKSIVDYKPVDLDFDSTLNIGWYQEGDNLYSNDLADTKLEAGESKELTLILTKQITENNMGLVNNLAEIAEADTTLGIKDIDSTFGNKKSGEDDLGSADLSIGIKTGAAVSYIAFTISSIVILVVSSYLISMKIIRTKREI